MGFQGCKIILPNVEIISDKLNQTDWMGTDFE